jgi:hypothetical protein
LGVASKQPDKPVSPGVLKKKLFNAAKSGDVKALRDALDAGIDVHSLSANKWTALHEACRYGQLEAVKVLLEAGADPNLPHPQNGFTPMVVATFDKGHTEIVRALLRGGAAPSLQDQYGWTPLHKVAGLGDLDALEALLQAGGDANVRGGPQHQTLLDRVQDPDQKTRIEALIARFEATTKQSVEEAAKAALRTRKPAAAEPYVEPSPLQLDQLRVTGRPQPAADADLQRLKTELAAQLPAGYEEVIRTLGPGTLRVTVRVQGPATILRSTKAWRERIAQYWFWGNGPLLSKEAAQSAVLIADTIGGDELVFLPTEPDTLLLLPHEDEEVQLVSRTGLLSALTRLVTSESGRVPARLTYEPTSDAEGK